MQRTRLIFVATGGTIANTPDGRLPIDDVLSSIERRFPELSLSDRYAVEVDEVVRDAAEAFTPDTWGAIGTAVQAAVDRPDVDGVVVTHGTYTVEETAYHLHLTVDTHKPVVITCAQRKHGTLGNDGDRNLHDALRVASEATTAGLGVLLVANETVHCARDVIKVSRRPDAFVSPPLGPLGFVDEDRVAMYRAPLRRHTAQSALKRPTTAEAPNVTVVAAHPGATARPVRDAVAAGVDGIVLQGYAYAGRTAPEQQQAVEHAAEQGVAVVLASRGREGRVPSPDTPDGLVRADDLATSKAVVLLTAALAAGVRDRDGLQRLFDTH